MEVECARDLAYERHAGQRDRLGRELIDHVARVAARVPPRARALAWLHDVLERTATDASTLRAAGLGPDELAALILLTRSPQEAFESYVLQIAYAPGLAGELARVVKVADLEDHLADQRNGLYAVGAPPYRWALRHLGGRPLPAWADDGGALAANS